MTRAHQLRLLTAAVCNIAIIVLGSRLSYYRTYERELTLLSLVAAIAAIALVALALIFKKGTKRESFLAAALALIPLLALGSSLIELFQ